MANRHNVQTIAQVLAMLAGAGRTEDDPYLGEPAYSPGHMKMRSRGMKQKSSRAAARARRHKVKTSRKRNR